MKVNWVDVLMYLAYLGFVGLAISIGPHTALANIALGLSIACAVVWYVARRQLGDAFSVTAQAHHLVTHGLYSKIRHPVYVFGTLAFLWVILALLGWGALLWWAIVIAIQLARVRREEQVLAQTFADEYASYRKRTWF